MIFLIVILCKVISPPLIATVRFYSDPICGPNERRALSGGARTLKQIIASKQFANLRPNILLPSPFFFNWFGEIRVTFGANALGVRRFETKASRCACRNVYLWQTAPQLERDRDVERAKCIKTFPISSRTWPTNENMIREISRQETVVYFRIVDVDDMRNSVPGQSFSHS